MRIIFSLLTSLLAVFSLCSHAESYDKIKNELQKQLGNNIQIKNIAPSPIPGLFEVVANNSVIYTDGAAKYLFQGSLVELKTGTNLTEQKEEELNRIKFSELPVKDAIKTVRGDGSRVIAVLADPELWLLQNLREKYFINGQYHHLHLSNTHSFS
jgi:thiol:disulfide interchange protein DsbC